MASRSARPATVLSPRKTPVQARGHASIQKLLDATHRLLKRDGPAGVTTPAIAHEAGVSVGSIYQYFPNKEAVILALYERKLGDIRDSATGPVEADAGDWKAWVRAWIGGIKRREMAIDFDLSMNEAIGHFPALAEVSRRHAEMFADIIAEQLRRFGSRWPDAALYDLALSVFYLNSGTWLHWSHAGRSLPQGIDRLAEAAIAVMTPAVENAAPPPPPYAKASR